MKGTLDRVYEVRIERDGRLSLPEELEELQLEETLALDPGPASVRIEGCLEFMRALHAVAEGDLSAEFVRQFDSRHRSDIGPRNTIEIPAELIPLRRGQTVRLQVLDRGLTREVYLLRDEGIG